jgi:hypothetical protein
LRSQLPAAIRNTRSVSETLFDPSGLIDPMALNGDDEHPPSAAAAEAAITTARRVRTVMDNLGP